MSIVDRRVRNRFGNGYGVDVACEADVFTRITLRLPLDIPAVAETAP